MARSSPVIQGQLLERLEQFEGEGVTAPCDGQLRAVVGLCQYSNNAVQRAMGSLVNAGLVVRRRESMLESRHSERPVTWYLNKSNR